MYHIAVCDDEKIICLFYTGEELYRFLREDGYYDMIFLDIELELLNGVQVGLKIREELKNEGIHIVYISANKNYAMDLFKVRPMDFLLKPLDEEKVKEVIKKGMELSNKYLQYFNFKQGHNNKKRLLKDILYFESIDRQIKMITIDEEIIFYGSLAEIYAKLEGYHFFYIHKSFLVNYVHVIEFNYEYITMSNKVILPISQSKRKNVRMIQLKFEEESL
ncbi:MAG: two-component response regulator [Lachnospiraceae bacterium]|nr:two-component response regulator [Lachnospiraceae bacterium]